jgi:alpha-L-rhamnosidase
MEGSKLARFAHWRVRKLAGCVCLLLGMLAVRSVAQDSPRPQWAARWITHPAAPLREPITLHFKKSFELDKVPAHYVVDVSADNRFVLYVNGERVGDGPARGDLAHWRYETFDLAPMLKAGANTLAATVWNFGVYGPVAQTSDRTAFLLQGDGKAEAAVNSDESWMVEVEPGQVALPRVADGLYVYVAVGPGEALHAAKYDWHWMDAGVDGPNWVHAGPAIRESLDPKAGTAASRGRSDPDNLWQLVADTLPHMAYAIEDAGSLVRLTDGAAVDFPEEARQEHLFPVHPYTVKPHAVVHLMFDRGELTTAYPKLMFSGGRGAKVTLIYAEALYDEQMHKGNRNEVGTRKAAGIRDEVYPDGGAGREFEPLWWRTWRYLDISVETGDDPLTLDGLEAYYTAYPFEKKALFNSSDDELNRIWKIGWHTAELDAHETYMDTPYWEQLQYAGDTRLQALITYAMTGDDRLPKQAMRALDDSRNTVGITESRYPSELPQYIPPFSLLWIGMVHDHYWYRADVAFVKEMLPGTRTVLDWFASYQHEDGLLGKLPWWSFIDWVGTQTTKPFPSYDERGESCLTTMQYIGALEEAIDLETAAGEEAMAARYRPRLESAKNGVRARCWDDSKKLFADSAVKDAYSQHTNMLAVLYDVAPKDEQAELMRKVLAKQDRMVGASYYFRFYLARALDHAGMADGYLGTLGDWRGFLKMGFTTWPEEPGNTRSDSHAWSAHPTFDLLTLVAGIGPGEPGFKTVRITPHLGSLTRLEAVMPHALGLIRVKYAEGQATLELPAGLSGVFVWKGVETALHSGTNSIRMER